MSDVIDISFVRLTEVDVAALVELFNEPLNARHMPLSGNDWTEETAAKWVRVKDDQWRANGYGPWAVLVNGAFAGWGGFQPEDNGVDFALVLAPRHWGHGLAIARVALERGFDDLGLDEVVIALPYSRSPDRVVARWGFVPDGDVMFGSVTFRQYKLTRQRWAANQLAKRDRAH